VLLCVLEQSRVDNSSGAIDPIGLSPALYTEREQSCVTDKYRVGQRFQAGVTGKHVLKCSKSLTN